MPFFREVVTLETRLPAADIGHRLRRITREPRSLREFLQRKPAGPPEQPDFIGTIAADGFRLSRLADVPSGVGRFYTHRPAFRGVVTATPAGTEIRLTFSDPGLALIIIVLSVGFSLPILAAASGGLSWGLEHAALAGLVAGMLWILRHSLRGEAASCVALLRPTLNARVVSR